MKIRRKVLALFLSVSLSVSCLSGMVYAEPVVPEDETAITSENTGKMIPEETEELTEEQEDKTEEQNVKPAETEENVESAEKEDDVKYETEENDRQDIRSENPNVQETAENDDPGAGRFQGFIPEEFYGIESYANGSGIQHADRFEQGYTIEQGIDVSEWNGDINWKEVKEAGIDFAIIRVAYRGYGSAGVLVEDAYYKENIAEAQAAGIPVGAYIFSQATNVKEAQEEANYILNRIKNYDIDLPVVLDFEYASNADGLTGRLYEADLTAKEATDVCMAFCETVESAGYTPMVYANADMLKNDLNAQTISSVYPVWLAHYTNKTDYTGDYDFWQYTSVGKVNGISGNVDMNYRYIESSFNTPILTSATKTEKGVSIKWKSVEDAEGYRLFRKTGSSSWKVIADVGGTAYNDTTITAPELYTYTVRAYKGDYEEAKDNTYSKTYWSGYDSKGINFMSLATPELKSAENVLSGVKVSWETVDGAEGYIIYRKESSGASWTLLETTDDLTYTDESELDGGSRYVYTVRACYGEDRSWFDAGGVGLVKLDTPVLTKIIKYESVELSWNEVQGTDQYYVYRKVPGGYWSHVATTQDEKYTESADLETGKEYIYTVRAYKDGDRSYYDTKGLRLWNLDTPELIKAENASKGITVSWNNVQEAEGYYVYRKAAGASSWTLLGKTAGTSYIDQDSLKGGITYLYTVRAYRDSDKSYFEVDGTDVVKLEVPVLTKIIKYASVELTWKEVEGAESYYIYRKVPGGHWSHVATTNSGKYVEDESLATGKEYVYTVRAYNSGDRSYYNTAGLKIWNLDTPELQNVSKTTAGVKVSWKAVDQADSYYVYRKAEGALSWTLLGKCSSVNYVDRSSLKKGTTYLYTVRAHRDSSNSYFDGNGIRVKL